jgi:uncharacterized protein
MCAYACGMTWIFVAFCVVGVLAVSARAGMVRGRPYAFFVAILLSIESLVAWGLWSEMGALQPLFAALQATVFLHFWLLTRPTMRPLALRLLVSLPASFFVGGTLLALPWSVAAGLGFSPWVIWLPYALAAIGMLDSLWTRESSVDLVLDEIEVPQLSRHPRGRAMEGRPLRIVQIADPHLGPFMSEARLRRICERAVERNPDLILLTGDFMTMESQTDPDVLARALAPLAAMRGKTFACMGNHDHEAPEVVYGACQRAGIELLVDDSRVVQTEAGPVQIVGLDFVWAKRRDHLARVSAAHPRVEGARRILLLHDPGAFRHVPDADLVLSGHTHGGQLGLLWFGLPYTFVSATTKVPDHGFWALGTSRLYVHRGQSHYGFPLRIGVPAENSVLNVYW